MALAVSATVALAGLAAAIRYSSLMGFALLLWVVTLLVLAAGAVVRRLGPVRIRLHPTRLRAGDAWIRRQDLRSCTVSGERSRLHLEIHASDLVWRSPELVESRERVELAAPVIRHYAGLPAGSGDPDRADSGNAGRSPDPPGPGGGHRVEAGGG